MDSMLVNMKYIYILKQNKKRNRFLIKLTNKDTYRKHGVLSEGEETRRIQFPQRLTGSHVSELFMIYSGPTDGVLLS